MRIENVTQRGQYIDAQGIDSLEFADDVRRVGAMSFMGCPNLKTVVFGERMEQIEASAFRDCNSLEQVEFPSEVSHIWNWAFKDCRSLKSIMMLSDHGLVVDDEAFSGCSSLEDVVIEEGITTISEGMFRDCVSLKEIELPGNVTMIRTEAFAGCKSLCRISFLPGEENVVVERGAFRDCAIPEDEFLELVNAENRRREAERRERLAHPVASVPTGRGIAPNMYGRTLFVCVNNTWGQEITSAVTHQRVALKDCAMGYWYLAGSLRARQAEYLMAVCHGTVAGVWRINQERGWLRPAEIRKETWPEDRPAGNRVGCELIDVTQEEWNRFVGTRPSDAGIEMRGGHIHYSFDDGEEGVEANVAPGLVAVPNEELSSHATRDIIDGVEIVLDPGPTEVFKRALIQFRRADRMLVYDHGAVMGHWRAERFTIDSSLLGNIRTSSYFREHVDTGLRRVILRIPEAIGL